MSDDETLRLLHEVFQAIHVRRFEHSEGRGRGPNNFYGGIIAARGEVQKVADRLGFSEAQVYHGKREPFANLPVEQDVDFTD